MSGAPRVVFLFPGTGHQTLGMGRDFNRALPDLRRDLDFLADALEEDLRETMFHGPESALFPSAYADDAEDPSLFFRVTAALSWAVARELERRGARPDAYAGRSAGEYTCLVAAGSLGEADGFGLFSRLCRLAREDCRDYPGRLLSVYGPSRTGIARLCRESGCELVTHLTRRRFSLAGGPPEAAAKLARLARATGGARCKESHEAGAFHTSLMRRHAAAMRFELERLPICPPRRPIWCSVDARPAATPARLARALSTQLGKPLRWQSVIGRLVRAGARDLVEIAPGRMLTEFLFDLPAGVRVHHTDTPAALERTAAALRERR